MRPARPSSLTPPTPFDFVLSSHAQNLLIDVKGRKVAARRRAPVATAAHAAQPWLSPRLSPPSRRRSAADRCGHLENWVTQDDIDSLTIWQRLFGPGFAAAFVFVYWLEDQPPDGLFQEIIDYRERWYAVRAIRLDDYTRHMKVRSPRWRTVHLPAPAFEQLSQPLVN